MNYIYPVNQVDIIKASDFQSQEISSLEDVVSAKYSDIKMDTDIQVSQIMEMVSNPESLNQNLWPSYRRRSQIIQ